MPALAIPYALHSVTLVTPSPETPWSIDPERTQDIPDTLSPTWLSSEYHSVTIMVTPETPWSIDPERTQDF